MKKIRAKKFDGSRCSIEYEDCGICECVDVNGKPYRGYRSRFKVGSDEFCSEIDVGFIQDAGLDAAAVRLSEDFARLEAYGVDPTTIEI